MSWVWIGLRSAVEMKTVSLLWRGLSHLPGSIPFLQDPAVHPPHHSTHLPLAPVHQPLHFWRWLVSRTPFNTQLSSHDTTFYKQFICLSDTGIDNSLCVLAHVRRRGFYFLRCTAFYLLPLWHKPFQGLCPLLRTSLLGQWDNLLSKYLFNVGQSYDSLFSECTEFKTPIFLSMNNSRQAICLWDQVVMW